MLEDQEDDKRKIIDVRIEDLLNRGVIQLDNLGLHDLINEKRSWLPVVEDRLGRN